jgi:hypothetical protein
VRERVERVHVFGGAKNQLLSSQRSKARNESDTGEERMKVKLLMLKLLMVD